MKGCLVVAATVALLVGCGTRYAVRHRVAPGEDLATIASRYAVSEQQVRAFNRLEDSDRVRPGDIVFIPATPGTRGKSPQKRPPPAATGSGPAAAATGPTSPPPVRAAKTGPPDRQLERRFEWPLRGTVLRGFGSGPTGVSRGLDIGAPEGTEIRAAGPGSVTYSGTLARAYGPLVIVRHDGNFYTVYANLGEARVDKGRTVSVGQVIGTAGPATRDLPAHVHFEVRSGEKPVDPLLYLPGR